MVLSPALQVIHKDEVALVTVMCRPQTPAVSNMLHWTFEPDYMSEHVNVADDKMSATVSGLDAEWHSSVTLHTAVGANPPAGLSTSAIVYFCSGHDNCPTNHISFPPNHTNMTINPIYRDCEHPFGDDEENPKFFLEVEAGRETDSGWQHLAWIDTDPETPGLQRRTAISRDNPPAIDWDTKATSSAPLSNGTDSLVYDSKTTFTRALPAVASGQYVPPPFVMVISRTFDNENNLVAEFSTTQAIPQYVQITWDNVVLDEFRQPIVFADTGDDELPPTNVTIFAGCSTTDAAAAFAAIPAKVQALFPANANIAFVGPNVNVPQPHKSIIVRTGQHIDPLTGPDPNVLGITPNEHCHQRNDSPLGTAYVYNGTIHDSLLEHYSAFHADGLENFELKNDWRHVPLPLSANLLADYIAQVALHECGHSMGLVPTNSAEYGGHNNCICGGHFMDSGSFRGAPIYLGFVSSLVQFWKPVNRSYLEFVFPLSPQGGNP